MTRKDIETVRREIGEAKRHVFRGQDECDYRDEREDRELKRCLAKARSWLERADNRTRALLGD